jgi:hypothetical protein
MTDRALNSAERLIYGVNERFHSAKRHMVQAEYAKDKETTKRR